MNRFHKTADISPKSKIGTGTIIWNEAQVREKVAIGNNCVLGKGVYIDKDCRIGNQVKIQNYSSLFRSTIVEDFVFIGPYVCFTNDKYPRSSTIDNVLKTDSDWEHYTTTVQKGASLGAGVIVLPGITIGKYAMIGAGSVVVKDVEEQTLVIGNPATKHGYVCICGTIISKSLRKPKIMYCKKCQKTNTLK